MRPVGIIEADHNLSSTISAELRAEGLQPVTILPEDRERVVPSQSFVLVILDMAAVGNAVDFCRTVSERQPVIAVAANGNVETCAAVLEAGADDCVPRSITPRELIARIRNVLWRCATKRPQIDHHGLDPIEVMRVRVGDQVRDLSRGEAEVLALLLDHAPAPLTIDEIVSLLQTSATVKRATIASRLKSLRQKLGPGWIEMRPGFGYQIVRNGGG